MHQCASISIDLIHSFPVSHPRGQVHPKYPVPTEQEAKQWCNVLLKQYVRLLQGLYPLKVQLSHLLRNYQTSAFLHLCDTKAEYIRTRLLFLCYDDSAQPYTHALNWCDYVKLPSENRLFRKKNKWLHHHHHSIESLVTDWNNSWSELSNPLHKSVHVHQHRTINDWS